jgi:hypothetical protein
VPFFIETMGMNSAFSRLEPEVNNRTNAYANVIPTVATKFVKLVYFKIDS